MKWAKRLARWGFYWAKRWGLRWVDFGDQRGAVILSFHSIGDAAGDHDRYVGPSICLSPKTFERHIALLAQRYRCVSMDDLLEALESRRGLPRNSVVITFDDGYRDNYDYAFPILRRYGVPAMFYVTTGCLDGGDPLWTSEVRYLVHCAQGRELRGVFQDLQTEYDLSTRKKKERMIRAVKSKLVSLPRAEREGVLKELRARVKADPAFLRGKMLNWKEVREMRQHGMHFGAHSVSHPLLPSVPLKEAEEEIFTSKAELEEHLKEPVYHFSYPNPGGGVHCSDAVKGLVAESGYLTAVTSSPGYVKLGDDSLELQRIAVMPKPWGVPWDLEVEALRLALSRATFTHLKHLEEG